MAVNHHQHPIRDNLTLCAGDKKALCRCWQSSSMPYCDGSHKDWNKTHDDQLGPIIIEIASDDKAEGHG